MAAAVSFIIQFPFLAFFLFLYYIISYHFAANKLFCLFFILWSCVFLSSFYDLLFYRLPSYHTSFYYFWFYIAYIHILKLSFIKMLCW